MPQGTPTTQSGSTGTAGVTGTSGPIGTTGTRSLADTEHGTSILMLDRVQQILDKASDGKGSSVTIDRGLVDEIRAELAQVKASLQAEKR